MSNLHKDNVLYDNHRIHAWEYANSTARTTATGFVAADVTKIALQLDTGVFYQLTATAPTWVVFSANGGAAPSGTAGGDLSGTFPNPAVAKINGATLGSTTATSGSVLIGSGTAWVTNAISGDITLSSSGVVAVTKINGATLGTTTATSGNMLVASGSAWVSVAMSGDATIASTGAITVSKFGGTAFASMAGQAASAVAITGGTVNGVTIGNSTAPVQAQTYRPVDTQIGTTYTLVLADAGEMVTLSNASAITLTIPTNASVAFPVGTEIDLLQLGAGQVTVAAAGGVTLSSYTSLVKLAGQYAAATLKKTATNTWVLIGNLA